MKIENRASYLQGMRRAMELIEEELTMEGIEWSTDACNILTDEFMVNTSEDTNESLNKLLRKHIRNLEDEINDIDGMEWETEEGHIYE